MTASASRPSWWIVLWGLIAALSVNSVLPALDHHAAEYSPFHAHVVAGAATPAERDALLQDHHHGSGQPHRHGPAGDESNPAGAVASHSTLTVIGARLADGLLSLAANAGDQQLMPAELPLSPPLAIWLALLPAVLFLAWRASPPPERPPRRR
jgi:hypothetical protein